MDCCSQEFPRWGGYGFGKDTVETLDGCGKMGAEERVCGSPPTREVIHQHERSVLVSAISGDLHLVHWYRKTINCSSPIPIPVCHSQIFAKGSTALANATNRFQVAYAE